MISNRSIFIIVFLVCSFSLFAQVEEPVKVEGKKKPAQEKLKFSDRLVFGADIGLSVGSYTYINISPEVGYRLTNRLTAGLGPIYIYENDKYYNYENSMYGGKVLASFTVLRSTDINPNFHFGDLILHLENEVINVRPYNLLSGPQEGNRLWIDNLLVGFGLSQSIGSKVNASILILWDVTNNPNSRYINPIFKVGFGF
jgi:hypothetical protein